MMTLKEAAEQHCWACQHPGDMDPHECFDFVVGAEWQQRLFLSLAQKFEQDCERWCRGRPCFCQDHADEIRALASREGDR